MTTPDLAYSAAFEQDIHQRIWLAQLTILQAQQHIEHLRALISHPRVLVVLHYRQYGADKTSDIAEGLTLHEAYHQLWHMTLDNGTGSPTGVEVGGCMVPWLDLIAEFGEYDPW